MNRLQVLSDFNQPTSSSTVNNINQDDRYHMIAKTAYFIAEQRGFQGNDTLNDWLQAEAKIDSLHQNDQAAL